jgi:hypothetical protein
MTAHIVMGVCYTKPPFDELKYPSYCPNIASTHDDHLKCLEVWTYAVRTRPPTADAEKSFTVIHRDFLTALEAQHVLEELPPDFLIQLVSTLVNGRHQQRAAAFRAYHLSSEAWSAIGSALIMSVKAAYAPQPWTNEIKGAWLRSYGTLLREVFRCSVVDSPIMSPSAKNIPGVTPP